MAERRSSRRRHGFCAIGWRPITPTGCWRCGGRRTSRSSASPSLSRAPSTPANGNHYRRPAMMTLRKQTLPLPAVRGPAAADRNRRRQGAALGSRPALHFREFRRRQAQRACPCRRPARRRGLRRPGHIGAVQPAVPLRRRRARQDPSDARDRLARPQARLRSQGHLSFGRKVHVPVHPGIALQVDDGLQGAIPLGRSIDDRRCAIHQRQGIDAGRILPHLQCAGRSEPADRDLGRQIALRPREAGRAHALAARLGAGRRSASDDLRVAARHPAVEGRAGRACECRRR